MPPRLQTEVTVLCRELVVPQRVVSLYDCLNYSISVLFLFCVKPTTLPAQAASKDRKDAPQHRFPARSPVDCIASGTHVPKRPVVVKGGREKTSDCAVLRLAVLGQAH